MDTIKLTHYNAKKYFLKGGNMLLIIKGVTVYGKETIKDGYIKIDGKKIIEVGHIEQLRIEDNEYYITAPKNSSLLPGMIDIHIHGAAGADVMDGTLSSLHTIAKALVKEGTTSFLATTMTQEERVITKALQTVANFKESDDEAEILGIHLEGPFIHPLKAGAQPKEYIIEPSIEQFDIWQKYANGLIKIVTLAPERPNGLKLVQHLKNKGVIVSIGHSDATYEQSIEAISTGASHFTHLYNAMKGLHHREAGTVGAALLSSNYVEMIVDGKHASKEMVDLAFKLKGAEKILMITDAMRAKYLADGEYDLGGQKVYVSDDEAKLLDGTLAGSILKMNDAVRNMREYTHCSLESIVQMTSANQAQRLNVPNKGSIAVGMDADVVILTSSHEVWMTICRGQIAYEREE